MPCGPNYFPRYENAIVVGDAAAEALAALKIYGRALVGGEIPGVERWHPTEKILASTVSDFPALAQFLAAKSKEMGGAYILIGDNAQEGENPAVMRADLEKAGCTVKLLDVAGEAIDVVTRAGVLFDRKEAAEAFAQEYGDRLLALKKKLPLPSFQVLVLLGMTHPINHSVFCLAATKNSSISHDVLTYLGCGNPIAVPQCLEAVSGMVLLTPERLGELILSHAPDVIALTGDETAAWQFLQSTLRVKPSLGVGKVFRKQAVIPLPWYCRPMNWCLPQVLETWYAALKKIAG